ncbi:MAG: hypothetical protein P8100_02300 [bacterium]
MIRYFQSAYPSQYIVIFLLLFIYWIPGILITSGIYDMEFVSGEMFYAWDKTPGYRISLLAIAFIITAITALLINNLVSSSGISGKIGTTGAFIYILLASSLSFLTVPHLFFIVNFLMVLLTKLLFSIPESKNQPVSLFNAGFISGVASLIAPELVVMLLLIWSSLLFHRSNHWRNFLSSLSGISVPWVFLWVWHFWSDSLPRFREIWHQTPFFTDLQILTVNVDLNFIILALIFLLTLMISFHVWVSMRGKNINLRHNLAITISFFLTGLLCLVLSKDRLYVMVAFIPATLLIVDFLETVRYRKIYDILLILFMLFLLINQYRLLVI